MYRLIVSHKKTSLGIFIISSWLTAIWFGMKFTELTVHHVISMLPTVKGFQGIVEVIVMSQAEIELDTNPRELICEFSSFKVSAELQAYA